MYLISNCQIVYSLSELKTTRALLSHATRSVRFALGTVCGQKGCCTGKSSVSRDLLVEKWIFLTSFWCRFLLDHPDPRTHAATWLPFPIPLFFPFSATTPLKRPAPPSASASTTASECPATTGEREAKGESLSQNVRKVCHLIIGACIGLATGKASKLNFQIAFVPHLETFERF